MKGNKEKEFKLGLALGGGGARGFAHLGIYKALEEKGVSPGIISGTSAGALAASFLAAGYDPQGVLDLLKRENVFGLTKIGLPLEGLLKLEGLEEILKKEIEFQNIEDLPTKLVIAVSELNAGKVAYVSKGLLCQYVVASCSIPFIFSPVTINGKKYVDGGLFDNIPISPLTDKCEKIIAVNISPVEPTDQLDSILEIAARTFQLSVNLRNEDIENSCDVLIQPDGISGFEIFDIKRAQELFDLGYEAARQTDFSVVSS